MRRNLRIWLVLSLLLLTTALVACESVRSEPENPADTAATMVAQGTAETDVTVESAAVDEENVAVTDGTATDGTAVNPATTDGSEATVVAVDGTGEGEAAVEGDAGSEATETVQTYAVQAGDTLQSIADQFGTTIDDLRTKNNLESDFLTVGQELIVAGDAASDEVTAQGDASQTEEGSTAESTDGSDATGDESSDATDNGQAADDGAVTPPTETVIHTVQAGEWIYAIARQYVVSPQSIIDANPGINPNNLRVGQQLTIPGTSGASTGDGGTSGNNSAGGSVNYVVQPGDTLYGIANVFGTTVQAIQQANRLQNNIIYAGQTLVIPQ